MKKILTLTTALALATTAHASKEVEVLHWWTAGAEAKAINALKNTLAKDGVSWKDMAISGGSGTAARQAVRTRVLANNPPSAYQIKGPSIQEWHEAAGLNTSIDAVAKAEKWDAVLPKAIANHMKCDGKYCAAPVNVHRVDQIWSNLAVLKSVGATPPKTWDEFNAIAEKLKAKGITPLAHGGQAWQDATVFEFIAASLGGAEYYKKVFVDLDVATAGGETTVKVLKQFRKLRGYVDGNFSGRDWNLATTMVANGKAGFQIMGDWAKGELLNQGKVAGKDFACTSLGNTYLYNVDSFAFFDIDNADKTKAQNIMAKHIVDKDFQITFNKIKGSVPARTDIDTSSWDTCAAASTRDMSATSKQGTLVPSYAHGMAMRGDIAGAITDVVTAFFNSNQSAEEGAKKIAAAIKSAK